MKTILREFKNQVKSLSSRIDEQSQKEEKQLVDRLITFGLMKHGDQLDTVLGLELKDIMARRLQTLLVKKGYARTLKQSRQFITHGHVLVNQKKITFPSYIVSLKEESLIEFIPTSTLSREDHPERIIKESSKDKEGKKKKEHKEEALPTFAPEEIEQIEEVGAVIKPVEKSAEPKPAATSKPTAKPVDEHKEKSEAKHQEKKHEDKKQDHKPKIE
jgi:small subunit ribosomal protein S4